MIYKSITEHHRIVIISCKPRP